MKTKTIIVESSPTARGENKSIAVRVDEALTAFLAENKGAEIKNLAVSGEVQPNSFNRVLIVLLYEGGKEPAPAAKTRAEAKKAPAAKTK